MEQTCPNCDRHCPVSALHCGRGREYFGIAEPEGRDGRGQDHHAHGHGRGHGRSDADPRAIQLLRACGRWLHHGFGDQAELVAPLTKRELQTLERLLEKCLSEDRIQG